MTTPSHMNDEGIYNSFDEVPGRLVGGYYMPAGGYYMPADGVGTRYVSESGRVRVFMGPGEPFGRKWIFEDEAPRLGIALPPNPNAPGGAIMRQAPAVVEIATSKLIGEVRPGRLVALKEPNDGDRAAAFFAARRAGECPCGRMREGCPYHG